MLTIVGTVPLEQGIYSGEAFFSGNELKVGNSTIPIERGTGALVASSLRLMQQFGDSRPYCLLSGDRTTGQGSEELLKELLNFLPSTCGTVVLHYMFIVLKYGRELGRVINSLSQKPYLIGDAGGMYLAKAAGIAKSFNVFTPDRGELAFLADPDAAHPMYTKSELFGKDPQELAQMAWEQGNCPQVLVVKGKEDLLYRSGELELAVSQPSLRSMEAIGGTGDTVTGLLAAFHDLGVKDGMHKALLLNRLAGVKACCTPRTRIETFIEHLDCGLLTEAGEEL